MLRFVLMIDQNRTGSAMQDLRCFMLTQQGRRYFNAEIDEPTLYDVTLNTGRMGFVRAAEVIAEAGLRHHQAFAKHEGILKVSVE
jgi:hypothetical protein